jgi:hypothetical protein
MQNLKEFLTTGLQELETATADLADLQQTNKTLVIDNSDLQATLDHAHQYNADLTQKLADQAAQIALLQATPAPASPASPRLQYWGMNIHSFNSPIYKDSKISAELIKSLGMNAVRLDMNSINPNGSLTLEDEFIYSIYPNMRKAGLEILPVLYTPGLSLSKVDGNYDKGFTYASGFAERYGKLFPSFELGNELALKCILKNVSGDDVKHYDPIAIACIADYVKGMFDGVKSQGSGSWTQINGEWTHFAFIHYLQDKGVNFDELTWHWYLNQETGLLPKRYAGMKIEDILPIEFPGKPISFNEVGFKADKTGFDAQKQLALIPLLKRLKDKGFSVFAFQQYDQVERLGVEGTFGMWDAQKQPKPIVEMLRGIR